MGTPVVPAITKKNHNSSHHNPSPHAEEVQYCAPGQVGGPRGGCVPLLDQGHRCANPSYEWAPPHTPRGGENGQCVAPGHDTIPQNAPTFNPDAIRKFIPNPPFHVPSFNNPFQRQHYTPGEHHTPSGPLHTPPTSALSKTKFFGV